MLAQVAFAVSQASDLVLLIRVRSLRKLLFLVYQYILCLMTLIDFNNVQNKFID